MAELRLVIPSAPRTKKTSNRVVRVGTRGRCPVCKQQIGGRPLVLPSEAWEAWRDANLPWLRQAAAKIGACPLRVPVNCAAIFFRDAARGDAVGYYQGLADLLQEAGVVIDDRWIETWDGSRIQVDHDRPRTEVTLTWLG